jgi:hypothetical protein
MTDTCYGRYSMMPSGLGSTSVPCPEPAASPEGKLIRPKALEESRFRLPRDNVIAPDI